MKRLSGIAFRCAAIGTVTFAIAGCGDNTVTPSEADPGFSQMIDALLSQAHEAGVTDTQVAALNEARAANDVTFAILNDAVGDTFDCFDEAGIGYTSTVDESQALPLVTYQYESRESGNPVAEACITRNSYFVEAAYMNQPRWQSVLNARIDANRSAILECLRTLGITVDDDATADEITQATHISTSELRRYLDAGSRVPVDCLVDYGAN